LPKSQVLSSELKTERVRKDARGDCEDGEDDELPCVIGESENYKGAFKRVINVAVSVILRRLYQGRI